jgi:hypothetical protein
LSRALRPDTGDLVREHGLMLWGPSPEPEERILILAAPLENAILKGEGPDAVAPGDIDCVRHLGGPVVHAQQDVQLPVRPRFKIELRFVSENRAVPKKTFDRLHVSPLIPDQAPDAQWL